ncbi:Retrovirus-related Pol polyprotein from transposon TNT 1-94 [Vitis vinifera]|uniref:Retrovirus-related Pol polyprotein from transposon TNT 1-94 n=1 Tax=Vitis vinifera TaxID=29760 RepID=A0A438IX42_VITVI|nr:Retrovirus-related Pol polyprotein from transposon TNT 1-94 [Vitis vinifera]
MPTLPSETTSPVPAETTISNPTKSAVAPSLSALKPWTELCVYTWRQSCEQVQFPSIPACQDLEPEMGSFFPLAMAVPEWRKAVEEEMEALRKNGRWKTIDLLKGEMAVGWKWVFIVKYNSDGSIERSKARLVAKGFTQTYDIDYQETFALVEKLNLIQVLSLVANIDWPLMQLDIKNAFLNGDLEEEVYMDAPSEEALNEMEKLKSTLAQEFKIKDLGNLMFFLGMGIAITHSGQISLAISQSDHLSLSLSLIPVISPCSQSQGRKRFPDSRIVVRKHSPRATFPANFPATVFFYTTRSAWRRSPICPKAPELETHPRAAHARFSGRRLHLTRRRVRAREPLSGDALPPPGSPDADQPPFLPVCAIRALHVPLLGFFCFRGPSDQIFRRPPAIFSQLQSLHVP